MQIAAFESIPSAAEAVAELRRAFAPQEIAIQHADRGLAFNSSSVFDHLRTAQVRVAAQRGNYAKLSRLAEMPSRTFTPISEVVIDALVEEGDWRGAAEFAERYDPRDQLLIEGFDDGQSTSIVGCSWFWQRRRLAAATTLRPMHIWRSTWRVCFDPGKKSVGK